MKVGHTGFKATKKSLKVTENAQSLLEEKVLSAQHIWNSKMVLYKTIFW